jgi:heme-degrading monooxygenase HmoA
MVIAPTLQRCGLGSVGLKEPDPTLGFLANRHDTDFNRRGDPMSIIRLIHIQLDPSENEKAEQVWKTECAPLMIQQNGCISEKLLRARAAGEFISYSEWESEQDIERYMKSDAHKEIVRHSRGLKGTKVVVKLYDLVK